MQLSSHCDNCWSSHIYLLWMVWNKSTFSKKGCWSVSLFILVVLLWTSGTSIIGHLFLIRIHKSATANAPLIINGAPSLLRGPWSCVSQTSFPDKCFLTFLKTLSAAKHASEVVLTPYQLKQWPGHTIPPLLVTCTMLMTYKMSSTSFSTAPIHTWSLSAGLKADRYFFPQFPQCVYFYVKRTIISCIYSFMHLLLFMSRLAVTEAHFLTKGLILEAPCKTLHLEGREPE